MIQKCLSCSSQKLESGSLQTAGRVHFHPDHAKFLSLKTSDVKVSAIICLDCGYLHLIGDAEKVNILIDENSGQ